MRAFPHGKRGEADLICEARLTPSSRRTAQDATTGERIHLLLCQSSGYSVFFPSRAFWLMCGSAFHDDAHNVFMTLPPYTGTRDGEVPQLGSGPTPCQLSFGVRKCSQRLLQEWNKARRL